MQGDLFNWIKQPTKNICSKIFFCKYDKWNNKISVFDIFPSFWNYKICYAYFVPLTLLIHASLVYKYNWPLYFIYKALKCPALAMKFFKIEFWKENHVWKKKFEKKIANFWEKKYFDLFSLCYPRGTQGFPQNISAHSVQPFGQL